MAIYKQLRENELSKFPFLKVPTAVEKMSPLEGVHRLVMLDRYAQKDNKLDTLKEGDTVVTIVKQDPKYPTQGFGKVTKIEGNDVTINIEYPKFVEGVDLKNLTKEKSEVIKPVELYWEQIAHRVAKGVADVEETPQAKEKWFKEYYWALSNMYYIPGGRILYGAGSGVDVTLFNCFSGDTIVQTKEGAKLIKDLIGEVEVLSDGGVYRKANFKSYGVQELFEVELANGEKIKTTAGHEWVVTKPKGGTEKVTTLDLEGRNIPIYANKVKRDELEVKRGIQHGIMYGDGSVVDSKYGHVLLFGDKKNLTKYFEGEYKVTPHYNDDYVGVYGLDPDLKGLPGDDFSDSYWYGFIVGLLATDGCVDNRGSVMFHSSNLDDIEVIVGNLYKTGFVHSSVKMSRELSPYSGEYAPTYKVQLIKNSVSSDDLLKPTHKEKFINSDKSSKQPSLKATKVSPLNAKEEVYCCDEPETHTFVVGTGYLTGNCFVLPYIQDSRGGIIEHIKTATEIMSRGGGVGSNISTLRPTHAVVHGVNGFSSGSVSWANYLAQLTHLIEQAGTRRGAQMIGLQVDHPDIVEFAMSKIQNHHLLDRLSKESGDSKIGAMAEKFLKRDSEGRPVDVHDKNYMTGANISILVTNDFMEALDKGEDFELKFPDVANLTPEQKEIYDNEWHEMGDVREWEAKGLPVKVYYTIKAQDLWDLFMICARYSAEPGVIFIDHYNDMSNSYYYGKVVVTNPCGEQGLHGFSVCNLGAMNLAKMYDPETGDVDWRLLNEVNTIAQRFSDSVIDASFYFLDENEEQALNERRVGKGVMGLGDLMIDLKLRYGSEEMINKTEEIFKFIATESYVASAKLAEEKGSFPLFDKEKFLESGFMEQMPEHVREAVSEYGIRNVTSLTVAPTGSTGTMAGVATGLEPYFAFKYFRSGRLGKFVEINTPIAQRYFDENPEATELPDYYVGAMDISPMEHVKVQGVIQRWVDSSLSKTANAPATLTVDDTDELYREAHKQGCKGVTIYVDGSRSEQVLSLKVEDNEQKEVSDQDLTNNSKTCKIEFDDNGNMITECH